VATAGGKINREEIAAIVDKFLAGRRPDEMPVASAQSAPAPRQEAEVEAGSMYAGPGPGAAQSERPSPAGNGGGSGIAAGTRASATATSANGNKAIDFVSEDDVKRAIQKGEKIYINAKTIITPAARDVGEPAEVFAKGQ
ncbi:MAG TPA: hypothetical protein VGW36_04435, partial [Pyrinomonadaceae bacterium]|nr:hypothetical protein [Pyrinomonadaceae bacterium]